MPGDAALAKRPMALAELKEGDTVMIVRGAEMKQHQGKRWKVLAAWELGGGQWVAKIKCEETGDYYSSYAANFLEKV